MREPELTRNRLRRYKMTKGLACMLMGLGLSVLTMAIADRKRWDPSYRPGE